MNKLIGSSRYIVILAVISAFIASFTLMIMSVFKTLQEVYRLVTGGLVNYVAATFIELADLYLLGVVIFIIAIGLYKLFIDENVPTPAWLEIHHLDDLKSKLASLIIVVLAVSFLKQVVAWNGETNLLIYGVGIAAVMVALTYFLSVKTKPG